VTWSRAFLAALLVLALTLGVAGVLRLVEAEPRDPGDPGQGVGAALTPPHPTATADPARAVLHVWDRRRATAWARGDPAALRALDTRASVAGVRDAAMLRRWVRRGLVVHPLATQVLGARVLERSPTRLVLAVTDRLTRAVAVGAGVRRVLPADRPSSWRLTLRRVAGDWRVGSVRAVSAPRGPSAGSR
jgi:hypothetical protein